MPYQPNIPNAADILRNSQEDIQGNFQSIGIAFDQNHSDFNSATPGQHYVVQMPVQEVEPVPPGGFVETDIGLYNLVDDNTGISELWYKACDANPSVGSTPITASVLSYSTPTTQDGWSYLPSGIILKWGRAQVTLPVSTSIRTVTFPVSVNIPVFSRCLQVITSQELQDVAGGSGNWNVYLYPGSITTVSFQYRMGYNTTFAPTVAYVNYLAIGY